MKSIKPTPEQKKAIYYAKRIIGELEKKDGNEAETRQRVERVFERVLGYDPLYHLSQEYAIHTTGEAVHADFAVITEKGPDAQPRMIVELKRIGVGLVSKHIRQATSYAIDIGCEWILVTNGKEWKLYHIEFGQPPKTELLESWNLLEDNINELFSKFSMIEYRAVKKGGLVTIWNHIKALGALPLLSSILADDTLRLIRRHLHKDTGIRVDAGEIYDGLSKLLNDASLKAMCNVSRPKPKMKKTAPKKEIAENKPPDPVVE